MKKGLKRKNILLNSAPIPRMNERPDEEGIETLGSKRRETATSDRMNERPDEEGIMGFVGFIELTGFVESWVCGAHEEVCGQRR